MNTAILVDGGFFLKRYRRIVGSRPPAQVAKDLFWMCREHLKQGDNTTRPLYRIFFYDCPPLSKKAHNPLTQKAIDFSKTPTFEWCTIFHQELKKMRKVALRLGYLNDKSARWQIDEKVLKDLLKGKIEVSDIKEDDLQYKARQKGIDVRIGVDITSIALKKQADQIILITGDSDFVPAAKLARREGMDIILDPMWGHIAEDLFEHIDGLRTIYKKTVTLAPNGCYH